MSLTLDLLERPTLALEVKEIEAFLAEEAKAREAFRDKIEEEKAEFINGREVIHGPARDLHTQTRGRIQSLLSLANDALHLGGHVVGEKAMCSFSRNDYEPDIALFGPTKATLIHPDTEFYPVPDFIVEILSPATAESDRGLKLTDYEAHGVAEYWIVDADERTVDQYMLNAGGKYQLAESATEIRPRSFPGLSIPLEALFDSAANLAFLKTLL